MGNWGFGGEKEDFRGVDAFHTHTSSLEGTQGWENGDLGLKRGDLGLKGGDLGLKNEDLQLKNGDVGLRRADLGWKMGIWGSVLLSKPCFLLLQAPRAPPTPLPWSWRTPRPHGRPHAPRYAP